MKREMKPGDLCIVKATNIWCSTSKHVYALDSGMIVLCISHPRPSKLIPLKHVMFLTSLGVVDATCEENVWNDFDLLSQEESGHACG